jgi:hypothetical protein
MSAKTVRKTGGFGLALFALAVVVAVVALASFLLPTSVGRLVADLWVGVISSIGQLFGG